MENSNKNNVNISMVFSQLASDNDLFLGKHLVQGKLLEGCRTGMTAGQQ